MARVRLIRRSNGNRETEIASTNVHEKKTFIEDCFWYRHRRRYLYKV